MTEEIVLMKNGKRVRILRDIDIIWIDALMQPQYTAERRIDTNLKGKESDLQ